MKYGERKDNYIIAMDCALSHRKINKILGTKDNFIILSFFSYSNKNIENTSGIIRSSEIQGIGDIRNLIHHILL